MKKTLETVISTVIFSLFNIIYYFFNFSKWGAIPVVLTMGYYILRVNNKGKEGYTLTEWVGVYFGALLADMLLIKACFMGIIPSAPIIQSPGAAVLAVCLLIAEVKVLFELNRPKALNSKVFIFFKYIILFGVTVGCSYIFIKWTKASIAYALVPVLFIALIIELFIHTYNRNQSHSIFSWVTAVCVLFNLANCVYPAFSITIVRCMCNLSLSMQYKWYAVILLLFLYVFGIAATISLRQKNEAKASDTKLYICFLFSTLFFWVIFSFVTKYNFIFIIIFSMVNIFYLTLNAKDNCVDVYGISLSINNVHYFIVLALTIGLPIAFYLGRALQHFALSCIVLFVFFQYNIFRIKNDKEGKESAQNRPLGKWFFWQVLLTLFAGYAVIVAAAKSRFAGNFLFIGILYVLATFALYIVNIQNKLNAKNCGIIRKMIVVPVIAIYLFSMNQSSIHVSYSVDDSVSISEGLPQELVQESGYITLKVHMKKKDASLKKVFYYWLHDKDNVNELNVGEDQENLIAARNDCLCLVCESESGVIFTDRHWFFSRGLEAYGDVGLMRLYETSETDR